MIMLEKKKDSVLGKTSSDQYLLNVISSLFNNMSLVNNQNVKLTP